MSQVPNYVSFGEPRSGTISLEFGITSAVSDLVGDIDPGPGDPLLQSGVSSNIPSLAAGVVDVSQVPNCVSFGELRSRTISPESGSVMAMSDFVIDIDLAAIGSWLVRVEFGWCGRCVKGAELREFW